jgi:hypothetical protein
MLITSPRGSNLPTALILLGVGAMDTEEVSFFNCSILAVAKYPAAIATGKATAIFNQTLDFSSACSVNFGFSVTLDMVYCPSI